MKSITADLIELAADVAIVEPFLNINEYGATTYGPAETYRVRAIGRSKLVMDADGNEALSGVTLVFFGEYGLTPYDRYTLPLRFSATPDDPNNLAARQPKALAVDRETDENGAHHTTVYFSVARLRGY